MVDVSGAPFELTIDPALEFELDDRATWWYWRISMRVVDATADGLPTAAERQVLDQLRGKILADLRAAARVFVIGATIHRQNYELMFYAADGEEAKVGGAIAEMKGAYPEEGDRLQGFHGKKDPGLKVIKTYGRA